MKVQAALPLSFSKNNEPQSTTSINLTYIMNPVFKSSEIDSTDKTIIKDISLLRLQLQENNFHVMQWKAKKERSIKTYNDVQEALKSEDLAEREKAIKEQQKAKSEFENISEPVNTSLALETRLNFLQSKSHKYRNTRKRNKGSIPKKFTAIHICGIHDKYCKPKRSAFYLQKQF